jgi:Zn-dependent protease
VPTRSTTATPGLRLGRIAGIDIGADPSWLFAILLVISSLASGFARWQSAWGPGVSFVVAFAGAALFFTSVLLHELAHAVVARAFGIPVHGITLFLFGGVSSLEREPTRPRDEFVTAIVGPLASFVLAALFLLLALAIAGSVPVSNAIVDRTQPLPPLAALFVWLAPVNFALGIFNLLPGFPLDGGRVLRSLLWRGTGDLRRATRIATSAGQALGWAFIALGVAMAFGARVPWFGRGLLGGLWIAAIGWFLRNAAFATMRDFEIRRKLAGLEVQQLMRHPPPTVPANVSVAMLHDHWLYTSGAEVFPVVWDERFAGWIDRASVRALPPDKQATTMVAHVMERAADIPVVAPTDPVTDALSAFSRARKPVLPVVQGGYLVGWLMLEDVMRVVERGRDVPALEPLWERGVRVGRPLET